MRGARIHTNTWRWPMCTSHSKWRKATQTSLLCLFVPLLYCSLIHSEHSLSLNNPRLLACDMLNYLRQRNAETASIRSNVGLCSGSENQTCMCQIWNYFTGLWPYWYLDVTRLSHLFSMVQAFYSINKRIFNTWQQKYSRMTNNQ